MLNATGPGTLRFLPPLVVQGGDRRGAAAPARAAGPGVEREIQIRGEMIRLGQRLQLAGLIDAGGEAAAYLLQPVLVNGEAETRRGGGSILATARSSPGRADAAARQRSGGLKPLAAAAADAASAGRGRARRRRGGRWCEAQPSSLTGGQARRPWPSCAIVASTSSRT